MARILLVDDDRDLAFLTKTMLATHGHQVRVFHDASRAIEQARREKPDIILMDIMLPEMSGAQAVRLLQSSPELKEIPVLFLTGLISSTEDNIEKNGINIDEHVYKTLGKPYEMNELLSIVANLVR